MSKWPFKIGRCLTHELHTEFPAVRHYIVLVCTEMFVVAHASPNAGIRFESAQRMNAVFERVAQRRHQVAGDERDVGLGLVGHGDHTFEIFG